MRGIKFRAWDDNEKIMYEPQCADILVHLNGAIQGITEKGEVIGTINMPPIILFQFTGLRDKNGKDIYEGDVVLCNGSVVEEVYPPHCGLSGLYRQKKIRQPFIVEWHGHFAGWSFRGQGSIEIDVGKRDYEVIGNIYENPELVQP